MGGILGRVVLATIVMASGSTARGEAVDNCVGCHETAVLPMTLGHSFADWRASPHGRANVGCEKCHGGDPRSTEADAAHKGVLPADNPDSRVSPGNLPATCGGCHTQELNWYSSTVHSKLLKEKKKGATCFTCHGAMATGYPTPRELAERCSVCHASPVGAREALVMVSTLKHQLQQTEDAVGKAGADNPGWLPTARSRLENLHKDYHGIQLKWHAFRTREVAKDSSDLLKLAHALDAEAELMLHREKK
jgi:hypothetical protein